MERAFERSHQTADDSTQIEYDPEPGDESTFELLRRIGHHNRPLGGPKNPCAASQQHASEDNIAEVLRVVPA